MRIPDDYPHCGAADEYGHPIPCEACIAVFAAAALLAWAVER